MRFKTSFLYLLLGATAALTSCKKDSKSTEGIEEPPAETKPWICQQLDLPVNEFVTPEEITWNLYDTASDFTVATLDGDWNFKENFTGCESYLLIQDEPAQASGWPVPLWDRDVESFVAHVPLNTQVLFFTEASDYATQIAKLEAIKVKIDAHTQALSGVERVIRKDQFHYVTEKASWKSDWVGKVFTNPGWGIGIDRFQRIRYVGSYADPTRNNPERGWFEPNLKMAGNEAIYYNFEADREAALDAENATVVQVFENERVKAKLEKEIEMPSAEALEAFDSVSIDLYMGCEGEGEYGTCPAWDYMAYLYMCDLPDDPTNPNAATACQEAVAQVMGVCHLNGEAIEGECSEDANCLPENHPGDGSDAYTCVGYAAAIPADTLTGSCANPLGETTDGTYSCNETGSGYNDISCGCGTEVGRWITTYHREGRWVYDVSAMLPLLNNGGKQRFRFDTKGPYILDMSFRFKDSSKDAKPAETRYLFSGGRIGPGYNARYEPIVMNIPASTAKVELATVISGHNMNEPGNCAEFCDIAHHFTINGKTSDEIIRSFPEASTQYDCMDKVAEGTIPNQYGTWWYGRSGWCPGKEVPTVMTDITDQITLGDDNTFEYRALYQGQDYPGSASIRMRSWIVISE